LLIKYDLVIYFLTKKSANLTVHTIIMPTHMLTILHKVSLYTQHNDFTLVLTTHFGSFKP